MTTRILVIAFAVCCLSGCGAREQSGGEVLKHIDYNYDLYYKTSENRARREHLNNVLSLLSEDGAKGLPEEYVARTRTLAYLRLFALEYSSGNHREAFAYAEKARKIEEQHGLNLFAGLNAHDAESADELVKAVKRLDAKLSDNEPSDSIPANPRGSDSVKISR